MPTPVTDPILLAQLNGGAQGPWTQYQQQPQGPWTQYQKGDGASLDQLERALRNADAAGDTAAARTLAAEIVRVRGSGKPVTDPAILAQLNQPDKYQKAAQDDRSKAKSLGIDTDAGLTRLGAQGATFNLGDEMLAGLATPLEMYSHGTFNPAEGYRYAKAKEDLSLDQGRRALGTGGALAAELAGGVLSGSTLARGGVTAARYLPQGASLLRRSVASALDGLGFGAVAGAGEGNSLSERTGNAAIGAGAGAAFGGAMPTAISAIRTAATPITSNIAARINPEQYAQNQVARAIIESGRPPQDIAGAVTQAANEGQGVFTLADALGNSGQRMLSTVARAPGAGRTAVVDFLEGRQASQGRRVANTLAEGFDSPETSAQVRDRLTATRNAAADSQYGQVRADARPVDPSAAIRRINETLSPGVNQIANPLSNIADDSVESVLRRFRDKLTDGKSLLTDFTAVQRVRGDLSDAIQKAQRSGEGNKARLLGQVMGELDVAMESSSAGHRAANANFRRSSQVIDAIDAGRNSSLRGRPEDTIQIFRRLTAPQQSAFRSGYVDPLIEQAQGAAAGVNKARPLTSDAFMDEAAAIAPQRTQTQMSRRLTRENQMFETRAHALGGSRTADNLADEMAAGIDPSMLGSLLTGNVGGLLRGAMSAGYRGLTGNTPAVREHMANSLLARGNSTSAQAIRQLMEETVRRQLERQAILRFLGRGVMGAGANELPALSRR